MRRLPALLASAALTAALACSDRSPTSPVAESRNAPAEGVSTDSNPSRPAIDLVAARGQRPVKRGIWGGPGASLLVREDGGTLQLLCAFGSIDQAVRADSTGRFQAAGTYTREMGAVPPGGIPKYAGRYSGVVHGTTMTLTISVPELEQTLGPYTLHFGVDASLLPCMVP
jgi:hypothetical protein